jgi:hypothetical protein
MAHGLHLSDPVEVVTDEFASLGAPRGAVGIIIDEWADGSNDVEVSDAQTGEVVARFRASEDEIRPYSGTVTMKEAREHGILFGRGDDLGAPVGDPPAAKGSQFGGIPGNRSGVWPVGDPSPDDAEDVGEIPWELRSEPPSGPIFH